MSRALLLPVCVGCIGVAVLTLTGCGDRSERAYYRSRYVPEHIDETYSPAKRAMWTGDSEVYELPASPPALAGDFTPRAECELPGPQFKSQTMVGLNSTVDGKSTLDGTAIGGMDKRPVPLGALDPLPGQRTGGQAGVYPVGVYTTNIPYQPAGDWDTRPRATRGEDIDVHQPVIVGGQRKIEKDDYCIDPSTPPALK